MNKSVPYCNQIVSRVDVKPTPTANRRFILPVHRFVPIIWQARFFLVKRTALFGLIGVLVALILPAEFSSQAQLMPEMNTSATDMFKRLSSVAGFASVELREADQLDAVRPDLYPHVLQSTPFALYLIDKVIHTSRGKRLTVGQLLVPDQPVGLFKKLLLFTENSDPDSQVLTKSPEPIPLSARQQELLEMIHERVSARFDTRSGLITLTTRLPDARAAARVTQLAVDYLTQYVTNYRTEKARQDLLFYHQQLTRAKQRYLTAESALFYYNDNHTALATQTATLERHRLETEWQLAQSLYTELTHQYEQAKLKIQEQTPVFKVLEPPSVPLKRTSPKRTLIVAGFTVVGWLFTSLWILARRAELGKQWRTMVTQGVD